MSRQNIFIPEHKTNVLPLRWLANYIFHYPSMWFFRMGLRASDRWTYEWNTYKFRHFLMEEVGWKMYEVLNKPYEWWGTVYRVELPEDFKVYNSSEWDDYDKNGIPYWFYLWSNDEETGDGWRLVLDDTKTK